MFNFKEKFNQFINSEKTKTVAAEAAETVSSGVSTAKVLMAIRTMGRIIAVSHTQEDFVNRCSSVPAMNVLAEYLSPHQAPQIVWADVWSGEYCYRLDEPMQSIFNVAFSKKGRF